jgi:hypothetical protein
MLEIVINKCDFSDLYPVQACVQPEARRNEEQLRAAFPYAKRTADVLVTGEKGEEKKEITF